MDDIRWKQRFQNYKKALAELKSAVDLKKTRSLSRLERSGLIQSFEFTQELSWKVLKDYLEYQGFTGIIGSRDAYRQAFNRNLITNGEMWIEMIKARNISSHTYEEAEAIKLESDILTQFMPCFFALEMTFDELSAKE